VRAYEVTANPSSLQVVAKSPVELLVMDPQGRRLGNVSANNDVFEIPRGSYFRDFPLGDDQDDGPAIGDPSGVKTVYVPAPGAGNYTLQVTGTDVGSFTLVFTAVASDGSLQENTISSVTVPGASVTHNISYSPTPGSTMSVTPGTGGPIASLSTSALTFSGQLVGSTSAPQSVTLTNTGRSLMAVASTITSGDFAETNTCGTSLAVGANCTIRITFNPTTAGAQTGTLTITDNSPDSPQIVTLTGTGTQSAVSLSSSSLIFSSQLVGTSSAAQTVTLTKTGNASLTISGITASGDFSQTNTCGNSVAAGANCTVSVTFKSVAGGTRTGTLNISDNAAGSPQNVALSGTGQDFTLGAASGSSTSANVAPGQAATYTLSVSGQGG
jgi:hypothetical protein